MRKRMIPLLLAACLTLTACAAAADLCHGRGWCAYVLVVGAGLCPARLLFCLTNTHLRSTISNRLENKHALRRWRL